MSEPLRLGRGLGWAWHSGAGRRSQGGRIECDLPGRGLTPHRRSLQPLPLTATSARCKASLPAPADALWATARLFQCSVSAGFALSAPCCGAGTRVAVEVDGPYHYASNSEKALGHTIVRRRVLRACGWRVVSIPFFEW